MKYEKPTSNLLCEDGLVEDKTKSLSVVFAFVAAANALVGINVGVVWNVGTVWNWGAAVVLQTAVATKHVVVNDSN